MTTKKDAFAAVRLSAPEEWCIDTLLRSGSRDFADRAQEAFGSAVRAKVIAAECERRCADRKGVWA